MRSEAAQQRAFFPLAAHPLSARPPGPASTRARPRAEAAHGPRPAGPPSSPKPATGLSTFPIQSNIQVPKHLTPKTRWTVVYFYRARWYLPETGEFGERDPVGYVDSSVPYDFVAQDPANWVDPGGNRIVILWYGMGSAFDHYDGMTQLAQKLVSQAKSRGQEYRLVEVVDYKQGSLVELERSPGYRDTWDDLQVYVVDQVSGDAIPAKEAVVREINEATDGTEELFLIGHSLGAVRSLQLARQLGRSGRRVQGLVAIDQFGRLIPSSNNVPCNVEKFLAFYSDPTKEIIKRRTRENKPHSPGSGKKSFDLCRETRNYGTFAVNETHQSIDNSDLVQDLIIEFLDGILPVVPGRDEERQWLMRETVPWPSGTR